MAQAVASNASTLIIPVENQTRELDAKLLLAVTATERGFPVILGSRAHVHYHAHRFPRGVYLAKSMRRLSERMFRILRQLGHEIAGWDEEALVRPPDAEYFRRRLSHEAMDQVSHLFAWGPSSAALTERFLGEAGCPVHTTGNPRIDLLRPEMRSYFAPRIAALQNRFGPFVLINTNFGHLNHFSPALGEMSAALRGRSLDDARQSPEFSVRRAAHRSQIYDALRGAIAPLARSLPSAQLVIRPHPSENHDTWRTLAAGLDNVSVCAEGSVAPWLLAATALVHNGCTTAVEAMVAGTPTAAFRPVLCEEFDDPLPNEWSIQCGGVDALIDVLRATIDGNPPDPPAGRAAALAEHLSALEGKFAADRIVDVLDRSGYGAGPPPAPAPLRRLAGTVHCVFRAASKRRNEQREGHRNHHAYHSQRFPAIEVSALSERLAQIGEATGRVARREVREIHPYVYAISPSARA